MWADNRLLEYDRYRELEAHLETQKKLFTARRQLEAAEASDQPSPKTSEVPLDVASEFARFLGAENERVGGAEGLGFVL
jgi:multidrug resistance efflux pump